MRQLDLFGSMFDAASTERMAEKPVVEKTPEPTKREEAPAEDFKIEQHSILAEKDISGKPIIEPKEVAQPVEKASTQNPIFFTDGKIGVKVKAKAEVKTETKPVAKTEANLVAKPIENAAIVKKEKPEKIKNLPQKRGRKSLKEMDSEVDLIEVPDDEELLKKQYYPIREVAKWFNVNTSLLRFWENEFDILKPRKNRKGDRMFRPEDVKNIHLIYQLLRQRKYTIEGAKEYLKANKKQADTEMQLIHTLHQLQGFLLDLKANLQ